MKPFCIGLLAAGSSALSALPTRLLGSSDLRVTECCLGTMTYGLQNSEAEAHAQLDYALNVRGVNFIDTAEMYPTPNSAPGWVPGRSEEIVGNWLATQGAGRRSELVVATKVAGYSPVSPVAAARRTRGGGEGALLPDARLDRASVVAACEASLRRLRTDHIDLFQLHWPDRYTPLWGRTVYRPELERADAVPFEETAAALQELLDAGKIRAYGLSNENAFGVGEWARAARDLGMSPPCSIQNSYSLLCRSFEGSLAEACAPRHHHLGLLPWSVLCGGLLSGKYCADGAEGGGSDDGSDGGADGGADGAKASAGGGKPAVEPASASATSTTVIPADATSRLVRFGGKWPRWGRRRTGATERAVAAYAALAGARGLTPAQLAILWCRTRPFVASHGSVIIGASSLAQLEENLDAFALHPSVLVEELAAAIDAVHLNCRDPSDTLY